MSTKIHVVNNGIPSLPVFAIYGRRVGERELARALNWSPPFPLPAAETRTFGRTLYSPRHHIDAQGRPIPVRISPEGRYVPSKRPATVHALDKPAPFVPTVRRTRVDARPDTVMRPKGAR